MVLDLFALLKRYSEQRQIVKQLENQLKSVTLKTKSQRWLKKLDLSENENIVWFSQQIQDQRQRRLNSSHRAARLVTNPFLRIFSSYRIEFLA